jgi:hypothetical protein
MKKGAFLAQVLAKTAESLGNMRPGAKSYSNKEGKQQVKPNSMSSLLAFLGGLILIFTPFVRTNGSSASLTTAKAESLAYQVAVLEQRRLSFSQPSLKGNRSPASLSNQGPISGIISQDGEGKPYHYEIHQIGEHLKISIWTTGESPTKTEVLIPLKKL